MSYDITNLLCLEIWQMIKVFSFFAIFHRRKRFLHTYFYTLDIPYTIIYYTRHHKRSYTTNTVWIT